MIKYASIDSAVEITCNRISPFSGEMKYLTTGELSNEGINDFVSVSYENKPSRADLLVSVNDLIVARMKATNKVLLVDDALKDIIVSTGFLTLKPKDGFDPRYLYHYFRSEQFQSQKDKYCSGSTQQAINNTAFSKIKIPVYNIDDQRAIVATLDKADALRQKRKQSIQLLDDFLKATFLEMFGDPVRNEKGWNIYKLGDITDLITDGKHGDCRNDENSGYYFISAKDIHDDKIDYSQARQILQSDFKEVDKRTNLKVGDLVIVNTGATIGKMAIATDNVITTKTTFQKSVAVIKTKREILTSIYLMHFFKYQPGALFGLSTGSAQNNLLLSQIRNIRIALPSIDIQKQYEITYNQCNTQLNAFNVSINQLYLLFNSLIQRWFG